MGNCIFNNFVDIEDFNTDSIEITNFDGMSFKAKACDIYDGDTLSMCFYNNGKIQKYRCRCLGYDSPEMRPRLNVRNRKRVKKKAIIAKEKFEEYLGDGIVSIKCGKNEKYGRTLITIYKNGINVNEKMIEKGYGIPYSGGTKK